MSVDRRPVDITVDELAALFTAASLSFIRRGQLEPHKVADDVLQEIAERLNGLVLKGDPLRDSLGREVTIEALTESFHDENHAAGVWQEYFGRLLGDRVKP